MKKALLSYARLLRYQLWKFDSLRYRGDKFWCPVCEGRFRAMKPFVGSCCLLGVPKDHFTQNAICPRCHSDIRHRFLVEFMRSCTDLFRKRQNVLHFAPEISIYKLLKCADLEYVVADIDPSRFVDAVYSDITDIPFGDGTFDFVVCVHVLEHIKEDRIAIKEIFRVLKENGSAILAVPTYGARTVDSPGLDYKERERQYGAGDHLRLNGLDFSEKLKQAGFRVDIVSVDDVAGNYIDRTVHSPHTESDKYLFFCTKPS